MKINGLAIKGFRSLHEVNWQPGDLNVIIGPNGSGKSNLLKALEMLSLSARGKLGDQVLREGGMGAIVWDGRAEQIEFSLTSSVHKDTQTEKISNMLYSLQLKRVGLSSAYRIEKEILDDGSARSKTRPHALIERVRGSALVYDGPDHSSRELDDIEDDEPLLSKLSSPFSSPGIEGYFAEKLAGWRVYQDFLTHREAPVRQTPVARYEMAIAPDGSNLVQVLHTLYTGNRDFKHDLNLAMKAAFGSDFEEIVFPPAADQRIQMRLRWKSLQREQSTADLSDGTLRFLYLIAILANPEPPALIAIDEPETGLHPSMLPIIAEYAVQAAQNTQVIFTTHSAEFLNAFGETQPTTSVAQWVDGKTKLEALSDEKLAYWLQDYTLGSLFRSGTLEGMA